MTIAAAQALALQNCLRDDGRDPARRFFSSTRPPVDDAWRLATGARPRAAASVPRGAGGPPTVRAVNAYLRRLHSVAADDAAAAAAFGRVVAMVDRPTSLFRARLALRVLRGPRRRHDTTRTDPASSTLPWPSAAP